MQHTQLAISICAECEHYRTADGKSGCGLFFDQGRGSLCRSISLIAQGGGCYDEPQRFTELDGPEGFEGQWISWKRFREDIAEFSSQISTMGLSGIAGVPRSGMVVASELAVRLGLPLFNVGGSGLERLSSGVRMQGVESMGGKVLVVDDSSANGTSIREAREVCQGDGVIFGAIYATEHAAKNLDVYHRLRPMPHHFEWHLLGCQSILEAHCVGADLDGLLCPDFDPEDDDDGARYLAAMESMPCIRHPGVAEIPYIVTARLERYRGQTEEWLSRHRIKYGELVMGPWATKAERGRCDVAAWKGSVCKEKGIGLYVESSKGMAKAMSAHGAKTIHV